MIAKHITLGALLAAVLAMGLALPAAADEGPDIVQQPHRAVYAMGLGGSPGVGGPALVRGVMVYEVAETCEAWKIDTKVLMFTSYGDEEVETLRKVATWESKDGLGFRFTVEETTAGKPVETIRGVAVLDAPGQGGVAEFTRPRAMKVELPKGTVFPTVHMIQMIRRSLAGPGHFGKVVFDGSTLDDPFVVSAIIGPAPDSKVPPEVAETLGQRPRWESRLAYFPVAKKSETPDFELTVVYRDDGIVEGIRQEYDDHVIDSRLRQLELTPRPLCETVEGTPGENPPPAAE